MRRFFHSLKKTKVFCRVIFLNVMTQEHAEKDQKQQLKSWHFHMLNF